MKTISIHDAKTNLSKYIADAKRGEKIYIGGFGKAEVQLVKVSEAEKKKLGKRSFVVAKGKIQVAADAFSPSTDSTVAELMLGQ